MAGNNTDDRTPAPDENRDWVDDPAATIPEIPTAEIWGQEYEALRNAIRSDDTDWQAVARQYTPDSRKNARHWDAESGSWKEVDTPAPEIPDPTAFTAQMPSLDRPPREVAEEPAFDFSSSCGDELSAVEVLPPAVASAPQVDRGVLGRFLAMFGF